MQPSIVPAASRMPGFKMTKPQGREERLRPLPGSLLVCPDINLATAVHPWITGIVEYSNHIDFKIHSRINRRRPRRQIEVVRRCGYVHVQGIGELGMRILCRCRPVSREAGK